jgi:hypothetical protein
MIAHQQYQHISNIVTTGHAGEHPIVKKFRPATDNDESPHNIITKRLQDREPTNACEWYDTNEAFPEPQHCWLPTYDLPSLQVHNNNNSMGTITTTYLEVSTCVVAVLAVNIM